MRTSIAGLPAGGGSSRDSGAEGTAADKPGAIQTRHTAQSPALGAPAFFQNKANSSKHTRAVSNACEQGRVLGQHDSEIAGAISAPLLRRPRRWLTMVPKRLLIDTKAFSTKGGPSHQRAGQAQANS